MDKSKKHMTPAEMKKKEEISSAMKRKDSKEYMQKKYGKRADEVRSRTAIKMAMKESYKDFFKKQIIEGILSEAEFQGMEDGIPVFLPGPPSGPDPNNRPLHFGPDIPRGADEDPDIPRDIPWIPPNNGAPFKSPPDPTDSNGNRLPGYPAFHLLPNGRFEHRWYFPNGRYYIWDGRGWNDPFAPTIA